MRPAALLVLLFLCACAPAAASTTLPAIPTQPPAPVLPAASSTASLPAPTPEEEKTQTQPALPATITPQPMPTTAAQQVCSPLEGITLAELAQPDLLKNPFQPPRPGMDDGHHGADFAYWSRGERTTMLGHPVQSVLPGRVAGIIHDREPYGYAVIIETPLEGPLLNGMDAVLPTPAPTVQPAASLFCPAGTQAYAGDGRSLYLLYAHLNREPLVSTGDQVFCGQVIGEVGTTGKSVNAHLHLETRVGPAGATFPAMAHYENDATNAEMSAYCTWRVSGLFQMFDPLALLEAEQNATSSLNDQPR